MDKVYWKGKEVEYTGESDFYHGQEFYEIRILEGHEKGQLKHSHIPPAAPSDASAPANTNQEAHASLKEKIGDLLARQWGAIKSAEINDIPTIAQYLAENLFPDEEAGAVNKYAHLIGLTYPDAQGCAVTVLDVDEHGRALMERGGEYWGCEAEYLEDIKAEVCTVHDEETDAASDLLAALDGLLTWALSNRGTEHEFVTGRSDGDLTSPALVAARAALAPPKEEEA